MLQDCCSVNLLYSKKKRQFKVQPHHNYFDAMVGRCNLSCGQTLQSTRMNMVRRCNLGWIWRYGTTMQSWLNMMLWYDAAILAVVKRCNQQEWIWYDAAILAEDDAMVGRCNLSCGQTLQSTRMNMVGRCNLGWIWCYGRTLQSWLW